MQWIKVHASLLTLIVGSGVITAWTLLRFFTKPIIYDLLGQQVLAAQWLSGYVSGSVTAPTNYILKIFFVYMPLSALHVDPKIELIITTVVINVVTYVCLFFLLRQILKVLEIKVSGLFHLGMLWIATAAGSIFWIQFSNSRNLEVVGGVFLLLLGLRFIRKPRRRTLLGIAVLATVLFFADPLQIYMTAASLVMYAAIMLFLKRIKLIDSLLLLLALFVAYIVASLLTLTINHFFSISFASISTFNQYALTLSHPMQALKGTILANIHFVSTTSDTGRLSQLINLAIIGLAIVASTYLVLKKMIPKRALLLIAVLIAVIEVIYFVSGQAVQGGDTSRYLIMLVVPLVLIVSLTTYLKGRIRWLLQLFIVLGLAINIGLLGYAFARSWTTKLPGESHITSVVNYLDSYGFSHSYASIDTSIPAAYFYPNSGQLLPLGCSGTRLVKNSLFYDMAAYAHGEALPSQKVAIILDTNVITNVPSVCTQNDIINQFGQPNKIDRTSDGSIVDIFDSPSSITNHVDYNR